MNIGKAHAIFENINSDKYTETEKLLAIHTVLEMETHNSITKANIINAFRWLWDFDNEQKGGAE